VPPVALTAPDAPPIGAGVIAGAALPAFEGDVGTIALDPALLIEPAVVCAGPADVPVDPALPTEVDGGVERNGTSPCVGLAELPQPASNALAKQSACNTRMQDRPVEQIGELRECMASPA
jgi:hypothetical protein